MKLLFNILFCSILFLYLCALAQAKEFKGIIPLESSRTDAFRILGDPQYPDSNRATYRLKEGNIRIIFTNLFNAVAGNKKLPDDIVYQIMFDPKPNFPLADLKLDLTTFKKYDAGVPKNSGIEGYINKNEGLHILTFARNVKSAVYFPNTEKQKMCPNCWDYLEDGRIILE